jgi:HAD superfamily hydrolase (TIGR01509 family)
VLRAVIFDLDGVLVDSEHFWDEARRQVAAAHGGRWTEKATADMQGMSSPEWSAYMREHLGVALDQERLVEEVVDAVLERYRHGLPLLPGAIEAVRRIGRRWSLALASSANRPVIDMVLERSELGGLFRASVSSEEVARGKPAPDVFLEAARRLGEQPASCAAVEDSANGIRAARRAGMTVVAVPNRRYPPPGDVLAHAQVVVESLEELTDEMLEELTTGSRR